MSNGNYFGTEPIIKSDIKRKANFADLGMTNIKLDEEWGKRSYLTPSDDFTEPQDIKNRSTCSADFKFQDTSIGGGIAINTRPQHNRYSDIRRKGVIKSRNDVGISDVGGHHGMGRQYSTYTEDPIIPVYFRPGVPEFNSLESFVSNFSNPKLVSLANAGRSPRSWLSKIINKGVFWLATVLVTNVAVTALLAASAIASNFFDIAKMESSKFYKIKPMAPLLWSASNTIVNTLLINEGINPLVGLSLDPSENKEQDQKIIDFARKSMPGLFDATGGIDVPKIIGRANRIYHRLRVREYAQAEGLDPDKYIAYNMKDTDEVTDPGSVVSGSLNHLLLNKLTGSGHYSADVKVNEEGEEESTATRQSFWEYIKEIGAKKYEGPGSNKYIADHAEKMNGVKNTGDDSTYFEKDPKIWDYMLTEAREGADFAIFNFDASPGASYSFTNSTKSSAISDKFNTGSAGARDTRFDLAGGNIGDSTGAQMVEDVGGFFKNLKHDAMESLDGITWGFTGAIDDMVNGANSVVPKHWDSSSATLPTMNLSTTLISWSNNVFSRIKHIYLPLSILMGMTLPLQTGSQSYTSPLYLDIWQRGKFRIPLGMITSLSIAPASVNVNQDRTGRPLAIDIKINIADLSPIMPVTIGAEWNGTSEDIAKSLTRDNSMSDYLQLLSGVSMYESIYPLGKLKKLARARAAAYGISWSAAGMAGFRAHEIQNGEHGTTLKHIANGIDLFAPRSGIISR